MTNYNDGNWHAHNGGECPVHPETVVEVVLKDETNTNRKYDDFSSPTAKAGYVSRECWEHREGFRHVIAFRVIKEHKEPREFWICLREIFDSEDDARIQYGSGPEIIHVREVIEV